MNLKNWQEVIFVGIPGPTHHYGGLSDDNVASSHNRGHISNPKQAALQALDLVRLLQRLGQEVAIMPPQLRPHLPSLREHFSGDDDAIIREAAAQDLPMLERFSSSSAMWVANSATVAPGCDTADKKLHITVANLHTNIHRRIEAQDTYRTLAAMLKSVPACVVHPPLAKELKDEGAANHMRLAPAQSSKGLHVFVYGTDGSESDPKSARQTLAASQAIAAQHQLPAAQTLFIKQAPQAIEAGVFHNDVIAVGHENLLLAHEQAYMYFGGIDAAYEALHPGKALTKIIIPHTELSLGETVECYFFNSQIVRKKDGGMAVIAPQELQFLYGSKAARIMDVLCHDAGNPIDEVHYIDLRQSMRNGGGPACLRLRVPMENAQLAALKSTVNVVATEALLDAMERLIERYYPSQLWPRDLGDPALYHQAQALQTELAALMKLG